MEMSASDLIAYIVLKGADAIAAESTAVLTSGDATTSDFRVGKYFEAEDFTFGIKLDDNEPNEALAGNAEADPDDNRSFARWRSLKPAAAGRPPKEQIYRSETEEFQMTRFIDAASPILIEKCLGSKEFDKLVVVKRARTGDASLLGFLKFEFTKVRIKSISWSDGDAIREVYRFNFDTVAVKYSRRKMSGQIQGETNCTWKRQDKAGTTSAG